MPLKIPTLHDIIEEHTDDLCEAKLTQLLGPCDPATGLSEFEKTVLRSIFHAEPIQAPKDLKSAVYGGLFCFFRKYLRLPDLQDDGDKKALVEFVAKDSKAIDDIRNFVSIAKGAL